MFTDMVGYTALAQADERAALAALERHRRLVRPVLARFHGREVKTIGDGFLVEFDSALEAANCAVELQRTLHERREEGDGPPVEIRIGIHVGDVVEEQGDVLGDAVNIASRIEPFAPPGGVSLSQQAYDQVENKLGIPLRRLPNVRLKSVRSPVTVYVATLPWASAAEPTVWPSGSGRPLAVLPLANISPDPGDAYFADGLTEELISVLSQVRGLSVIARTSVETYRTAPKPIPQIGAELGVDTVLEGSVRKAGNRIRITLQLIDVPTQSHVWANRYDREIDDVFAVQTEIAERTAEALRLELAPEAGRKARRPTANPAAYDQYLRGLAHANVPNGAGFEPAIQCFEQATRLDPTFAEAYAAWANLYVASAGDFRAMREVIPRARELAARALELDPDSSEAHAALANALLQFDNDMPRAEAEFRRALELNPSNDTALRFYGMLLMAVERFEPAKEMWRRLAVLDPAGDHRLLYAWAEIEEGHIDRALAYYREEIARVGESVKARNLLGFAYVIAGRRAEARREADQPLTGASDVDRFDRGLLWALVGRRAEARAVLREAEAGRLHTYVSATDLSMIYSALGEKEEALRRLEEDFAAGNRLLWLVHRGPFYDPLRDEPRFLDLLQRSGVPSAPPARPMFVPTARAVRRPPARTGRPKPGRERVRRRATGPGATGRSVRRNGRRRARLRRVRPDNRASGGAG